MQETDNMGSNLGNDILIVARIGNSARIIRARIMLPKQHDIFIEAADVHRLIKGNPDLGVRTNSGIAAIGFGRRKDIGPGAATSIRTAALGSGIAIRITIAIAFTAAAKSAAGAVARTDIGHAA